MKRSDFPCVHPAADVLYKVHTLTARRVKKKCRLYLKITCKYIRISDIPNFIKKKNMYLYLFLRPSENKSRIYPPGTWALINKYYLQPRCGTKKPRLSKFTTVPTMNYCRVLSNLSILKSPSYFIPLLRRYNCHF